MTDPIGEELSKELDHILSQALDDEGKLTAWEQAFVSDLIEKHARYRGRLYLSEKQWEIIERIRNKLEDDQ